MLDLRYAAGRNAQRRGLDRQRQDPRPEYREHALPRRHDRIARDQRAAQPVALQLAQIGQHLLLARLRLGKPLLGAGARTTGSASAWSSPAATVHIGKLYGRSMF
jgi:hypothetical protein